MAASAAQVAMCGRCVMRIASPSAPAGRSQGPCSSAKRSAMAHSASAAASSASADSCTPRTPSRASSAAQSQSYSQLVGYQGSRAAVHASAFSRKMPPARMSRPAARCQPASVSQTGRKRNGPTSAEAAAQASAVVRHVARPCASAGAGAFTPRCAAA
jgi:hypothetical protein